MIWHNYNCYHLKPTKFWQPKIQLLHQTGKKLFKCDRTDAYPGKCANASPLQRKVIHCWRHWDENPDLKIGFWHCKTISDQRIGVPTYYPVKQQFKPARLTYLKLSSPAKQNTIGIHVTTAFSWQHFITLLADFTWKKTYSIHGESRGCHDEV